MLVIRLVYVHWRIHNVSVMKLKVLFAEIEKMQKLHAESEVHFSFKDEIRNATRPVEFGGISEIHGQLTLHLAEVGFGQTTAQR